jgi:hypothetical protein
MRRLFTVIFFVLMAGVAQGAEAPAESAEAYGTDEATYDKDTIIREAEGFFGKGAKGLAEVIEKVFKDHGRPNGYIVGEEISGAIGFGLRYGDGTLKMKYGAERKVHWQGPSIGFDVGANASKAFVLVYNLPSANTIFQRFPGVDGSLYFVAGVGVTYVRSDNIVLAPIRAGVGWRAGASVGYMHFTRQKTWNPF